MTRAPDFDAFYRDMHPRLWAFLVRTTNESQLADDLTQEAFVRLLGSRGAALPERDRRAYLFRIAENLVRDVARRRAKENTTSLDDAPEPAAPDTPEPMSRRAADALAAISEQERKLLWLAHVEGWSHADIASLLGLATGSIRVLLHRARRRYQSLIEKEEAR